MSPDKASEKRASLGAGIAAWVYAITCMCLCVIGWMVPGEIGRWATFIGAYYMAIFSLYAYPAFLFWSILDWISAASQGAAGGYRSTLAVVSAAAILLGFLRNYQDILPPRPHPSGTHRSMGLSRKAIPPSGRSEPRHPRLSRYNDPV